MTSQVCNIGILFGDVAGSTRLYDVYGDRAALTAIETCVRIMSDAVERQGGVVVKTIGDEVMAAFPSAGASFAAALAMQSEMDGLPPLAGPRGPTKLCLRVGFHFGPALEDAGDYFGDTVNVASRMVGLAKAGQIITTGDVLQLLTPAQRVATRDLDRLTVKGKNRRVPAVEVMWRDAPGMTQMFKVDGLGSATAPSKLRLRNESAEWLFDDDRDSISLGREDGNDVVIAEQSASRSHATIERRGEKWVLIDHSTNGTFVVLPDGEEIRLNREEMILHGAGVIGCGRSASGADFSCLRFTVS